MKFALPGFLAILLLTIIVSCKKDPTTNTSTIDMLQARFTSFELAETAYSSIDIKHPELNNNSEVNKGEIHITIPKGNTQLKLTPKTSNFNNDQFIIRPQLGQVQNFSGGKVTYTISSIKDPAKRVHYEVTIVEEQDPVNNQVQITNFKFEKSKNPGLPSDIDAAKIIHSNSSIGKIFVFVPAGTDFSKLTPTITYSGQGLYYSQDELSAPSNSTTIYPAGGTLIDFAYPKKFYAVVKSASEVWTYDVIVDVRDPIKFTNSTINTGDVVKGKLHSLQVSGITNQGNHPISLVKVDHKNQIPSGLNVIRAFRAVPSFGLKPKERIDFNVNISAQTYPPGTYRTTAVFTPGIYHEADSDKLLQTSEITINSTIID
jgi:hypothetical protein